jgi:diadenosine tetraphosphate (Ap4A) HIT family hydrolase
MSGHFQLHPRLQADTVPVGRLELCVLLLMNDANYPWLILVPERAGIDEIHQLDEADQQLLMRESCTVSRALATAFAADKMNIAALGNVVPQLHLHHIVRYRSDPAWPAPAWGRLPAKPYEPQALAARLAQLRQALGEELASI